MTKCNVFFSCVNEDKSRFKLKNAWVYWRENGAYQILRSDAQGLVYAFGSGNRERQDSYTVEFKTTVGAVVYVFYTEGSRPLPEALIAPCLQEYEVPLSLDAGPDAMGPLYASPNGSTTSIRILPLGEIRLPRVRIRVEAPADEPSLWPLLFENLNDPSDDYYTDGIPQGVPWCTQTAMQENAAAASVGASSSIRLRGLPVKGFVPATTTNAAIQLLDSTGNAIPLLQDGSNSNGVTVNETAATLGSPSGDERPFSVNLFLPPTTPLGPVHLVIKPGGLPSTIISGFTYHLVGIQIGLVDDFTTNANGQQAGPPLKASDEVYVVDYLDSPSTGPTNPAGSAVRAAQQGHTRVRRMVRYAIRTHHTRSIPLAAVASPAMAASSVNIPTTQMPFWMAELQFVGINRAQLEDLLIRRLLRPNGGTGNVELEMDWALDITWEGPDRAVPPAGGRPYTQPPFHTTAHQNAAIVLDAATPVQNKRLDHTNNGIISNAIQPTTVAPAYPIASRRAAGVRVAEAGAALRRTFGRSGTEYDTLVVEWQPPVTSSTGDPIIRGGNGHLRLTTLNLSGNPIDPGLLYPRPTPSPPPTPSVPPTTAPILSLPKFRVYGINPSRATLQNMVDAITEEYYRNNIASSVWLAYLSLDNWKATARLVVGHETDYRQFATPPNVGVRRYQRQYHGYERDMAIFGPPSGYGLGQLDPPGNADRVWDVEANARECINRLLLLKGGGAFSHLSFGAAPLSTQRRRAIFQRETVRRYNGGREFVFDTASNDWMIRPSVVSNLDYVNNVFSGAGAVTAVVYPPPTDTTTRVQFVAANYFPGI
jgi:hypothetical protein